MSSSVSKMSLKFTSIYAFRYNNPSTKNLPVWDRAPLVIFFGITKTSAIGINIHWIPAPFRKQFIGMLLEAAERITKGKKTKIIPRFYYDMLKNSKFAFARKAVRRYHVSRITSIQELPPELWQKINPSSGKFKPRKQRKGATYRA